MAFSTTWQNVTAINLLSNSIDRYWLQFSAIERNWQHLTGVENNKLTEANTSQQFIQVYLNLSA